MNNFTRHSANIELQTQMHVRKMEELLDKETNPLKREMYRKIIKMTLTRMENMVV